MNIRDYAQYSNNGSDWTEAFKKAFSDIAAQGGGELRVPAGVYPTGAIELFSNTTLYLENGSRLSFISDDAAYPMVDLEFEGLCGEMHMPCVFARNASNIRITGDGVIDGNGEYWWKKIRSKTLTHWRPYLVCFTHCERVTLENVTLTNSPCWTVHPHKSKNITIRNISIKNPADSPNTDGIDPNACSDVRILGCNIDVGDDCIAIKSGTEDTENRQPCERIIISDCHFLHGHGGVVLGSEMSGSVRDVSVSNCIFHQTDRGIRLKTRRGRGGEVSGIRLSSLMMDEVMCAFVFNMYYFCGKGGKLQRVWDKNAYPVDETTPSLKNVCISDVVCRNCTAAAGYFYGLTEMPVENVSIKNVTIEMKPDGEPGTPAMMNDCPVMQAGGFFLRNVQGLSFEGVTIKGVKGPDFDLDETVSISK